MRLDLFSDQGKWRIAWQGMQMQLQLIDGDLYCAHYGPAHEVAEPPAAAYTPDPLIETRAFASVQFAPDDRRVTWGHVEGSQVDDRTCVLRLYARFDPVRAEARFCLEPESGMLRCRTTLYHTGGERPVTVKGALSFSVTLPPSVQEAIYLSGVWGGETQTRRIPITHAQLHMESRAGKTGYEFAPYLAVLAPQYTCIFEIGWSGNWQMDMRRLFSGHVHASGGLNAWGLRHTLRAGSQLALPEALMLCVQGDLNRATQCLHDYWRTKVRPNPERAIPVQFNTWIAHGEHVDVEDLKQTATHAAELGCEVFVLDAGWFTLENQLDDANWYDSVGDWVVRRDRFPNGLEELSAHVAALGMGFGIWFEPEACSPGSVIQRQRPEWLHRLADGSIPHGRVREQSRGIVNLGIEEARAFQRARIGAILRATNAVWLKVDCNLSPLQGGWADSLPEGLRDEDPLIAHCRGLYKFMDEIRLDSPELTVEGCAGGGGRMDAEIAAHCHTLCITDEMSSLRSLAIAFGAHLAQPALECNRFFADWPPHYVNPHLRAPDTRGDLAFRTRVAMLGALALSAPLAKWTPEDFGLVRAHIDWYRRIVRPLLRFGDQYLLTEAPPLDGNGEWTGVWYVAKDGSVGVLFAFRLASANAEYRFALPALEKDVAYCVRPFEGGEARLRGDALAAGLVVTADQPFRSALIYVERLARSA